MTSFSGYRLTEQIYAGEKTLVFRAVRLADGLPVVLKTLAETLPPPREFARLRHEFQLISGHLAHGVACAVELVESGTGLALVMKDVGGITVRQLIEQDEPLTIARFLALAQAFASSLARVHAMGIIHKDINPGNLVVNVATNEVEIIDFGIATQLSRETAQVDSPGHLVGTLTYMSPEQTGRMNRTLDYRTDFYSLGASFYEMLTGGPPFAAVEPAELVHCHLARVPVRLDLLRPEVPAVLGRMVERLMAKMAEDRYQSAMGLVADLEVCSEMLGRTGSIADFKLGERDATERFRISQKLYGREHEVRSLLEAFDRVSQGRTELLLVAGYSGVGKTALVHEVQKPITSRQGYFIAGKFDQLQRNVPYASLIQAFQELTRQLLTETSANVVRWHALLADALGSNARVIVDVIPELEAIVGALPPVPELPPQEAQNRFQNSFWQFIGVFARPEHPLVLFLDDLQWADFASLRFIEDLLQRCDTQSLLIVGAYRENELHAAHPFSLAMKTWQTGRATTGVLALSPLSLSGVEALVEDSLLPTRMDTRPLAALVFAKTAGNPFFVNVFLTSLYESGTLRFLNAEEGWCWDLSSIEARQITDNVIDLMCNKLRTLPPQTQDLLVRAACIGHQFEARTLAISAECTPGCVMAALWPAMTAGLVHQVGNFQLVELAEHSAESLSPDFRFRFVHDRVQQAAYALRPAGELTTLHLSIARLWLSTISDALAGETLFAILNQYHAAGALKLDEAERIRLTTLSLQAGRKAMQSSAFNSALRYLAYGVDLLVESDWDTHHELTLALSLEHAECNYLNHHLEDAENGFQACLARARTATDKAQIHLQQLELHGSQGDSRHAIADGLAGLRCLGIVVPRKPTKWHMIAEFARLALHRRGRNQKQLLDNLPMSQDPKHQLAMRLFAGINPYAFFQDTWLTGLLAVKAVNQIVRKGLTVESSYVLMTFASLMTARREFSTAWLYAQKALELIDSHPSKFNAMSLYLYPTWIHYFFRPLASCAPNYEQAMKLALEAGNWIYACLHAISLKHLRFSTGMSLRPFADHCREVTKFVAKLGDPLSLRANFPFYIAWAESLATETADGRAPDLSPAVEVTEAELLNPSMLFHVYISASLHAFIFDDLEKAGVWLGKSRKILYSAAGVHTAVDYFFLGILLALGRERAGSWATLNKAQRQRVKKDLTRLHGWARQCPENFLHKYLLGAAELARVQGQAQVAEDLFAQAIAAAQRNGFAHHQAIAAEALGRHYFARDRPEPGRAYMEQALELYSNWGAEAKVQQLSARYGLGRRIRLHGRGMQQPMPHTTRTLEIKSEALDLATVLKASQALSGEIVLEHLLTQLMRIVVENAGAQRGLLLFERKGQWWIEAEGVFDGETHSRQTALPAEPSAAAPLPVSLLRYVALTKEAVVLSNAATEGRFVSDPYIQAHLPRSVLCAPILRQGVLSGIVYVENNLMEGAFTQDRLEMLRVISAQAAISIENARVYEHLEATVAQRTSELATTNDTLAHALGDLRAAQAQLVQTEKLAALGSLVAGVAHELNTPIGNALVASTSIVDATTQLEQAASTSSLRRSELSKSLHKIDGMAKLVARSCERAATLITTFKQLTANQATENRRTFVLRPFLQDCAADLFQRYPGATWRIEVDVPEGVTCDSYPDALGQILARLVDNAAIHAFAGREAGCVHISGNCDAGTVTLLIEDDGNGIDATMLARVFEPFFTTRLGQGGSGLGLSIARNIACGVLCGDLEARSNEQTGSAFVLRFPASAPAWVAPQTTQDT